MTHRTNRTDTTLAWVTLATAILSFPALGVPPLPAAGNQAPLLSQAAGHLLNQDFTAAQEAVARAVAADDSQDTKQLQQSFTAVGRMPEFFFEHFRKNIGKELSVTLRGGTQLLRITQIGSDKTIQAEKIVRVEGHTAASIPSPFALADIPPAERFKLLGDDASPERHIMRGLLAWEAKKPDTARKFFADSACPLGKLLLARISELNAEATATASAAQQAAQEAAAAKAYDAILKATGLASMRGDPNKLVSTIETTRFTEAQVAEIKKNLKLLEGKQETTETAKANKAVLDCFALVRPNFPIIVDQATLDAALEKLAKDNPKEVIRSETKFTRIAGGLSFTLNKYPALTDLSALVGIPVVNLRLTECASLTDLRPIAGMPLTDLLIRSCDSIADLRPLAGMPLKSLALTIGRNQRIADFSPLAGMPLENLHIIGGGTAAVAGSRLKDLNFLKGMSLKTLDVPGNEITDLNALKGMPLEELYVWNNFQLDDMRALRGMPLKQLVVGGCPVKDLSPLKGMLLKCLSINSTAVVDLSPLKGMPLEFLDISATGVKDLSPVKDIKNLKIVR